MLANCVYAVFNIKSDIVDAQQPYIGNDFMLKQFAESIRSNLLQRASSNFAAIIEYYIK